MPRTRTVAAIAATAGLGLAGLAAVPADAGRTGPTLVLEKVVQGEAPADAEFVISVFCTVQTPGVTVGPAAIAIVVDDDFFFGPEGGVEEIPLGERVGGDVTASCDVEETETGGAVDVTPPFTVEIDENIDYDATVTNVFDSPGTTGTAIDGSTTTSAAAAAGAARATPRFTG